MDEETLNSILQEKVKPEVSFLSELNKETIVESEVNKETVQKSDSQKVYKCSKCSYETTKLTELMLHSRREHPKPRVPKEKIEERSDNNTKDKEEMTEDTELVPSIEMVTPVETEEAKPKKKGEKKDEKVREFATLYDRLETLLKGYQVRGVPGIIQSANMYDIGNVSFISVLKDLLRNTSTAPGLIGNIADAWSQIIGVKTEHENPNSNISGQQKPSTPNEALSLISKLREEELNDTIMENYRNKMEDKKLDIDIKRKRLSGELSEGKGMSEMEKLIAMMQIIQPKDNGINDLKLELIKMQSQPKDNGISELKAELSRLQSQLLSTPKIDTQIESLKLQIDAQNKRNEELQRQILEESRQKQYEEKTRVEREILEKKMDEQNKQIQELMKQIQLSSVPKAEDTIKQQISEIQKQSDAKLQVVLDQLRAVNEAKKDDDYRRNIELLKEEIKSVKENAGGQIAQVADSMKDFATNITHAFEKKELSDQHSKETEELKKKISDSEHSKSLTNEQYMLEKTTKIAEEGVKAIGGALDGFGKALQPATQKAAETTSIYEKAKVAMDLKNQGFNEQTIASILNQPIQKPSVPSARSEYDNLAKMTEQLEQRQSIPTQPNLPIPIDVPTQTQSPVEQIKFSTSNNE